MVRSLYLSSDQEKLESQRASVREHIEKYKLYSTTATEAINMALRTIKNCQEQIKGIIKKHPHWTPSWEDTWKP